MLMLEYYQQATSVKIAQGGCRQNGKIVIT